MSFDLSGANIVPAIRRAAILAALALFALTGCGQKEAEPTTTTGPKTDQEKMQETLNEVVARWHAGDKGVLYENEFDYVRQRFTFDQYLKFPELKLNADTVQAMNVQSAEFLGGDSSRVKVEVVFQGPTGKISRRVDTYMMFLRHGKWIRPTMGTLAQQREWDSLKAAADSAADAEAKELDDK